jgi:5-methylcytosine-specific restriction protein A
MPAIAPKHQPADPTWGQGRGGRPWRRIVARIKARDKGLCQTCKREGTIRIGPQCDHIKPLSQGGTDDESNLEMICIEHHEAKTRAEGGSHRGGGEGRTSKPRPADTAPPAVFSHPRK